MRAVAVITLATCLLFRLRQIPTERVADTVHIARHDETRQFSVARFTR